MTCPLFLKTEDEWRQEALIDGDARISFRKKWVEGRRRKGELEIFKEGAIGGFGARLPRGSLTLRRLTFVTIF